MKKSITIAAILLAMSLASCTANGGDSSNTGDSGTTTAATTEEVSTTVETENSEPKLTIEEALKEYTVYESAFAKGESGREQYNELFAEMFNKNEQGESVPEYYAVRFAENRDLAVVVHNMYEDDAVYITRVFHNGKWAECEVLLFAQQYATINDWGDIIYMDLEGSNGVVYSVFVHDGIAEKFEEENKSYSFYNQDGKIRFTAETLSGSTYPVPLFLCDADDFFRSFGEVSVQDGKIVVDETETYTAYEFYMSDYAKDIRESYGSLSWEDYVEAAKKEYNNVTDAPTLDIEKEENIPFRLLKMTFSEIEAEFGTLERTNYFAGGYPVYVTDKLPQMQITFSGDGKKPDADPDQYPEEIAVFNEDTVIYPGLKIGMTGDEVSAAVPEIDPTRAIVSYSELGQYQTHYRTEDYSVSVYWSFPQETVAELEQNMLAEKTSESYWANHEFNGTLGYFRIYAEDGNASE